MAGLGTSAGDVTSRFCRLSLAAISIKIILNKEICALSKLSKLMTSSTLPPHHIPLFAEKKVERKSFQMRVKQEEAGKRYTHTQQKAVNIAHFTCRRLFLLKEMKNLQILFSEKNTFFLIILVNFVVDKPNEEKTIFKILLFWMFVNLVAGRLLVVSR